MIARLVRWSRVLLLCLGLMLLAGCRSSTEITEVASAVPEPVEEQTIVELITPELETSCATDGAVLDLEVVGDRLVFAGEFTAVIDAAGVRHERAGLAACTFDGDFVEGFANPTDGLVRVATLHEDRLLLGGNFSVLDDDNANFVAVDARTGTVDPDFGPTAVEGSVHSISIGPSGSIYVAGAFGRVDGVGRTSLVRLDADGSLDSEFFPRLTRTEDDARVRVVYAVVEDGSRVYIGGDFGGLNEDPVPGVGAVDIETGRINASFTPDIFDANPLDSRVQIRQIIVKGDWVYLCGDWWITEGRGDKEDQRNFGRFSRAGEADASLEPATDGGIRDCQFIGDTMISLGGHFDTVSGAQLRKLVIIELETGEVIRVMGADSNKGVQTIVFDDGRIIVGGTFNKIKGIDQPGIGVIRVADPELG